MICHYCCRATSLTDLTCGPAPNAAAPASSIAAKASGQINVLSIRREPRRSHLSRLSHVRRNSSGSLAIFAAILRACGRLLIG